MSETPHCLVCGILYRPLGAIPALCYKQGFPDCYLKMERIHQMGQSVFVPSVAYKLNLVLAAIRRMLIVVDIHPAISLLVTFNLQSHSQ